MKIKDSVDDTFDSEDEQIAEANNLTVGNVAYGSVRLGSAENVRRYGVN